MMLPSRRRNDNPHPHTDAATHRRTPAHLLDNESPPGPHRPSQPLLPGAGETPQPDRKRARRPGRARRVGGALLPALAAIIAVSLSVQAHAQTSVPHDWSLKPSGLDTSDKFRLLFVSSTKRNANPTAIATYNTFVQTRAAAGHTDIQAYSAGFKVVGCTADRRRHRQHRHHGHGRAHLLARRRQGRRRLRGLLRRQLGQQITHNRDWSERNNHLH